MWDEQGENLAGILRAQGAARVASLSLARLRAYETEAMTARRERLPFEASHAFVAAFPFFAGREAGNLPLYLRGADYTPANKRRLESACTVLRALFPGGHFHPTGNGYPLPVVQAGRLSGLGTVGRHGLLMVPGYGSTVTLGAILTDIPLPEGREEGYCEGCGACLRACPTHAIWEDEQGRHFDKTLCRAYISQKKEADEADTALLAGSPWVLGCDDCQNACSHNWETAQTVLPEYREALISNVDRENLPAILEAHKDEKKWRSIRRNLDILDT